MSLQPPILEPSSSTHRGINSDTGTIGNRLRTIENIIETYGKLLPNEGRTAIRDLVLQFYDEASKSNGTFLQDVILCGTEVRAAEMARSIASNLDSYTRSMLFIASHDTHLHVIHDCSYAGGSCRCFWRKKATETEGIEFRKRLHRQRRRGIKELTPSDWVHLLLYFSTEGRNAQNAYFKGKVKQLHFYFLLNM